MTTHRAFQLAGCHGRGMLIAVTAIFGLLIAGATTIGLLKNKNGMRTRGARR